MLRHSPFWLDRFPASRRPSFPRWRGDGETGVVVIGGGLTGCACAYALAAAGKAVVLLEADRVGTGATAASDGVVRADFDASFETTAHAHGLKTTRVLWQGVRRASLDFAAALRRLGVRCDLDALDRWQICHPDAAATRRLRREYQARRDAGLDHRWLMPETVRREAALDTGGAIKSTAVTIDPYQACLGLAAAALSKKARIFEGSGVTRVRDRRAGVEVVTDQGMLRAEAVVITTAARLPDLRALRRHLRPRHAYAVVTEPLSAVVRRELGTRAAAIQDDAEPPHRVRWLSDDRVLITGAEQPTIARRAPAPLLVQHTGQLMYELSLLYPAISGTLPAWSWRVDHDAVVDGLPCIGPHRNFPRHFFALGQGTHGAAIAWLAGRLAVRFVLGRTEKTDEAFGFSRIL